MTGLRLLLILAIGLTVVYVSLWAYIRAGRAEGLKADWARDRPPLPEHTFVANGLRDDAPALRRKLVLWVYVVPLTAVAAAVLILNDA